MFQMNVEFAFSEVVQDVRDVAWQQFQQTIQNAIDDADLSGYDTDGTRWFYDKETNTVVYDGSTAVDPHAGTAFPVTQENYALPDGTVVTDAAGDPLP